MGIAQTRRLQPAPARGILATGVPPVPGRHVRYLPSDDLAEFIEHFWTVSWNLAGGQRRIVETLPHPSVHVVVGSGRASLVGVQRGKFSRYLTGNGWAFGIKFHPGGFRPFLGRSVSTITDRRIPLTRVTPWGRGLRTAILDHEHDHDRATAAEAILRAVAPRPDARAREARDLVYLIRDDASIRKVEDILHRAGTTKRSLQRLFEQYVGASPKWVIQRYRLHEAAERLKAGSVSGSRLALELGYADQAHFIRDFKAIVGISPGAYARRARTSA